MLERLLEVYVTIRLAGTVCGGALALAVFGLAVWQFVRGR